ncbi:MAG: PAAR-like domain-containing protein [Sandaracinaceae bacterium]
MGVKALNMDVVCEDSSHKVVQMAPCMCITPCAPSPLPMPYPIIANSAGLKKGTKKVKQAGKKTMNAKGAVKTLNGNEAGTQKDIVSFKTGGTSWPMPVPAVTIHFEGAPISITGTPGMTNST